MVPSSHNIISTLSEPDCADMFGVNVASLTERQIVDAAAHFLYCHADNAPGRLGRLAAQIWEAAIASGMVGADGTPSDELMEEL